MTVNEPICPEKSMIDDRSYTIKKYGEYITVLFVEDQKSNLNALSIAFQQGAMDSTTVGLAHFLEHTVFQGSKESDEDFQKRIANCGGYTNASTKKGITQYDCTYQDQHFDNVATEFFKMMVDPKLEPGKTDEEKKAVMSEHNKNICNDGWRLQMVHNELLRGASQKLGTYGCGTDETLREVTAENAREFHKGYFKRPINIVVYSKQDRIETVSNLLTDMIDQMDVDESDLPENTPQAEVFKSLYGNSYQIVTLDMIRDLIITFEVDSVYRTPEKGDFNVLSLLIGDSRTLEKTLVKEKLIYSIDCGIDDNYDFVSTFSIHVRLTELGYENWGKVSNTVYAYIEKLKVDIESNEDRYTKLIATMKHLNDINFDFSEGSGPYNTAEELVQNLIRNVNNLENTLKNTQSFDMDYDQLKAEMSQLDHKKSFVIARSFEKTPGMKYELEKYFKVEYRQTGQFQYDRKHAIEILPEIEEIKDCMPSSIQMIAAGEEEEEVQTVKPNVFLKTVTSLKLPKVICSLKLFGSKAEFPTGIKLPDLLKLNIFSNLLMKYTLTCYFSEFLFSQLFSVHVSSNGIKLVVKCYSKQLTDTLKKGLDAFLAVCNFDYGEKASPVEGEKDQTYGFKQYFNDNFENEVEDMILGVFNSKKGTVLSLCEKMIESLSFPDSENDDEYLKVLNEIKRDANITLVDIFKNCTEARSLYVGNLNEEQVVAADQIINEKLKNLGLQVFEKKEDACQAGLRFANNLLVERKSISPNNTDNCVIAAFDFGGRTIKSSVAVNLMTKLVSRDFSEQLRDRQQLGYIVALCTSSRNDNLYWQMVVESARAVSVVEKSIKDYIEAFDETVEKEKSKLSNHIDNSILALKEPLDNLESHLAEAWAEIENKNYNFDAKREEIKMLETLKAENPFVIMTKAELLEKKLGVFIVHGKHSELPERDENTYKLFANHTETLRNLEGDIRVYAPDTNFTIKTNVEPSGNIKSGEL